MKRLMILTTSPLVFLTLGCETTAPQLEDRHPLNAWMVNSVRDTAINRAIVTQHTLFPYHFVANAARLNELGRHDVEVLAGHYREHPGKLSIRRGHTTTELYEARIAKVKETLAEAGVETDRVQVSDALAGGEGMASERVLVILETSREPGTVQLSEGTSQGVQTGL